MATQSGLILTTMNQNPHKRMVTDRILMVDPLDIAAYSYFGTDIGRFAFVNREGYKYAWLEDTYVGRVDTVASGLSLSSSATTCTVTTPALFQVGDVWKIENEYVRITAMSGDTATITRGFGGTTPATHADGTQMVRISRAAAEGANATDSPSTEVEEQYNYTQIFTRTINVSRTAQKIARYGISDPVEYEIDKAMDSLMMDLARLPYYGKRYLSGGVRMAGGFRTFITDNLVYATSTGGTGGTAQALTQAHFETLLTSIFEDGGDPDVIFCGSWAQRKINEIYTSSMVQDRSDKIGGAIINKLLNPVTGRYIDIIVDRNCPANELWCLSSDKIAFYPFDPFFYEELAKTGDAVLGHVVGEYGLVIANGKAHGAILEFSTSA